MPSPPDPPELAYYGFKILGEQARSAIPALARRASDPTADENAASLATHALGCMGPRALPEIISILTNRSAAIRLQAAFILREFGTNAIPAVPALLHCLTDTDKNVAVIAMSAVPASCLQQDDVFTTLVNTLQDPRREVRESALSQISRTGPRAAPILEQALKGPNLIVRHYAIHLLLQRNPMELTNPPVFAAVTNLIYCSPEFWHLAVQALGSYGKSVPGQTIRTLTSLSQDADEFKRAAATNALRVLNSLILEGATVKSSPGN